MIQIPQPDPARNYPVEIFHCIRCGRQQRADETGEGHGISLAEALAIGWTFPTTDEVKQKYPPPTGYTTQLMICPFCNPAPIGFVDTPRENNSPRMKTTLHRIASILILLIAIGLIANCVVDTRSTPAIVKLVLGAIWLTWWQFWQFGKPSPEKWGAPPPRAKKFEK
jgi:hypothetical protein